MNFLRLLAKCRIFISGVLKGAFISQCSGANYADSASSTTLFTQRWPITFCAVPDPSVHKFFSSVDARRSEFDITPKGTRPKLRQ